MVSIVLLTTEEVLQRNGFWYCLDSLWVTEELDPFEDIKPEHFFSKPLSRDFYYAKFPEIPRSESEEENSISLNGFKNKHYEWKSKIGIKKLNTRRKSADQLNASSGSSNKVFVRRSASLIVRSRPSTNSLEKNENENKSRVHNFISRLLQNVPPPPLEVHDEITIRNTIHNSKNTLDNFNDIDIPEYADFENDAVLQSGGRFAPTSTMKRHKGRVSFNTNSFKSDFDYREFWYETIYGVSELMTSRGEGGSISQDCHVNQSQSNDCTSWSEIISACGISNSLRQSKESLNFIDELLSFSHHAETRPFDVSLDEDEELGYSKFVVHKIHQSLIIAEGMPDSSPMRDLSEPEDSESVDKSFNKSLYRIVPLESVIVTD